MSVNDFKKVNTDDLWNIIFDGLQDKLASTVLGTSDSGSFNDNKINQKVEQQLDELLQTSSLFPMFQLNVFNWKPILYTAIIVAIKFLDDRYFWNIDIVNKLKLYDLQTTNHYEHMFLNLLDFQVGVSLHEFDNYIKCLVLYGKFRENQEQASLHSSQGAHWAKQMTVDN